MSYGQWTILYNAINVIGLSLGVIYGKCLSIFWIFSGHSNQVGSSSASGQSLSSSNQEVSYSQYGDDSEVISMMKKSTDLGLSLGVIYWKCISIYFLNFQGSFESCWDRILTLPPPAHHLDLIAGLVSRKHLTLMPPQNIDQRQLSNFLGSILITTNSLIKLLNDHFSYIPINHPTWSSFIMCLATLPNEQEVSINISEILLQFG
jgi:hypothetical protein